MQIRRYKANFFRDGKKLTIQIRIKEWDGENVSEAIRSISHEIKERLDRVSGLKDNLEIVVKVEKITSRDKGEND